MQDRSSDGGAAAAPLRILAAGAVKAVVLELAPSLEARVGRRLDVAFDTVGALRDRVLSGEPADATVLSHQALDAIAAQGFGRGRMLDLGQTGVALGCKAGIEPRSLATSDAFQDVLTSAATIGYADPDRGATAGRHFVAVLERMGLSERLKDRLRMYPFGVDAVSALGRGEVDIAVSQATEILTQPDVTFLGVFPEPYDLTTGYGAIALSKGDGAQLFLEMLKTPASKKSLRRAGFA